MKLHRIRALVLKHGYRTISSSDRIMDMVFWPVLDLVIWGFTATFVEHSTTLSPFAQIFIGGVILWWFFDRAQKDVTIYVMEDFWDQSVYNLYTSPIKESELFISTAIVGFARAMFSFVLLFIVAVLGYQFNILEVGFVTFSLFTIPLFIFGWAFGLATCAIIYRYGSQASIMSWVLPFLIQPISAVFYPLSALPKTLQILAQAIPLTHIFEGFREALQGSFLPNKFILAIMMSLAYFVIGYLIFLWSIKKSKESGFLSKQ